MQDGAPSSGAHTSQSIPDTPAALWAAARQRFADRPSFVFLRHLRPLRLEGDTLLLAVAPGQREVLHVATPQRLEPVAQTLSELRQRRTRIELQTQSAAAPSADEADDADGPQPPRAGQLDRRTALQLPLVRAAMQAFPDALLVEARDETPDDAGDASADDAEAEDALPSRPPSAMTDVPEPEPDDEDED